MAIDQDKIQKTIRKLSNLLKRKSHWRSAEKVHDLRTRSRRLEAVVRALMLDQEHSGQSLLKAVIPIFKQAGKVRDMDVLTASVSGLTIEKNNARSDPSRVRLIEHLQERRQKSAHKLRDRIAKHETAIRHGLKQCSSSLESSRKTANARRLQLNASAFALQLGGELAVWPRLTSATMHAYRLKLKALRYTLQMAEGDDTAFVTALEEVTDAIGEWHDWSKLLKIAVDVLKQDPGCPALKTIRSATSAKRQHALLLANRMRRQYLSSEAHRSPGAKKLALSEPLLSAIATLASPSPRITRTS
jgi:CHAD domain-containing protein